MKMGDTIHYDTEEDLIEDLFMAYRRGQAEMTRSKTAFGSHPIKEVIGPILIGQNFTQDMQEHLARKLWQRREDWLKTNPRKLTETPVTALAIYLNPRLEAGGS